MIDVSNKTIQAFLTNSYLKKQVKLEIFDGPLIDYTITPTYLGNEDIVSESLQLEQHLCDGEGDFVGCVSSTFSISLMYSYRLIKKILFNVNNAVKVYIYSEDNEFEEILIFTGYIYETETDYGSKEIKLTCHDLFSTFYDSWKVKENIKSICTTQGSISVLDMVNILKKHRTPGIKGTDLLVNSSVTLTKADLFGEDGEDDDKIIPDDITAREMLRYICQINGVYGVVNNEGYLEFRKYNTAGTYSGTYPSETTYPSNQIFPGDINSSTGSDYLYVPYSDFKANVWGEQYETPITGVTLMATSESKLFDYNYTVKTTINSAEYAVDEAIMSNLDVGEHVYTCTAREEREISPGVWGTFTTWDPDGTDLPGGGVIDLTYVGDCDVGDTFTVKLDRKGRKVNVHSGSVVEDEDLGHFAIKVVANPFIFNKEYEDKKSIAVNLYNNVAGYSYPYFEADGVGLPFIEVGDYVNYYVNDIFHQTDPNYPQKETRTCLIFNRTLKGIQHMTDTYSAEIYDYNHADDADEATHFINALSGLTGNSSESNDDTYTDNNQWADSDEGDAETLDNYDTAEVIDNKIDDAIGDASNVWSVEVVDSLPTTLEKKTIYFVKGTVIVE